MNQIRDQSLVPFISTIGQFLFTRILVLCTGNICRSPYGEAKLKSLLPDLTITSAGIATEKSGLVDKPADPMAIAAAKDFGFDISNHRAKQVTQQLVDDCDLIFAMERNQLDVLCEKIPTARSKGFVIGQWIGLSTIDDPFQKDEHAFRQAFSHIDRAAESWARKLTRQI